MKFHLSHLGKAIGVLSFALMVACQGSNGSALPQIRGHVRMSAVLKPYNSCLQLEQDLKQHLKDELKIRLAIMRDDYIKTGWRGWLVGIADGAPSMGGAPLQQGVDYSGTNNQEAGVDEVDFIKTDGNYIYALNGNLLEIAKVAQPGKITYASSLKFGTSVNSMLLFGQQALVFSSSYGETGVPNPNSSHTKLSLIDLSADRSLPKLSSELLLDGDWNAARRIGSKVYLVTSFKNLPQDAVEWLSLPDHVACGNDDQACWTDVINSAYASTVAKNEAAINNVSLSDLVPRAYLRNGSNWEAKDLGQSNCTNYSIGADSQGRGFVVVASLDMTQGLDSLTAEHVVSNDGQVYMSQNALVFAEQSESPWWFFYQPSLDEATNIHRFTVSDAGQLKYSGSGRIDGTVLNQFSMSESNGNIRVVATTGRFARWFLPQDQQVVSENHLYVLGGDSELSIIGSVTGLAKGERIWSSRFVGDKAYLVTFQNTDPLFTIDISDPNDPKLIGELKVPGVSTYIHSLDDGHVFTVGYGGDSTSLNGTTQVSLFDVSAIGAPKLVNSLPLSVEQQNGWSSSEANQDHLAITYWGPLQMAAIPMQATYWNQSQSYQRYESKLVLILAKPSEALTIYAELDQSDLINQIGQKYARSYVDPNIHRSIFIKDQAGNNFVYAISSPLITVYNVATKARVQSLELKGWIQ